MILFTFLDMSFMPLETYEELKKKEVKVANILSFHFARIICCIHRKLSFKQKFKNPWTINVSEYLSRDCFYEFFRAVRDYKIAYGRKCEITNYKTGDTKEYVITFTHLGCFRFHLCQTKKVEAKHKI